MTDDERIIELESQIAHLQRDLDQLGTVVYEQQKLIEELRAQHEKVLHKIQELQEDPEQRDSDSERPPHY